MSEWQYLKFLDEQGRGPHSGWQWPIGEWVDVEGTLVMCKRGIHVCTLAQALSWMDARCHPVEVRGERLDGGNKLCVRSARLGPALATWNERTQRLFAADCAERIQPIYEARYPEDLRPRNAITVVRRFAAGDATREELAAARHAATDAAVAAAWAAARAAAEAAGMTARAAADAAAWAAARAAAGAAEIQWQAGHLAEIQWQAEHLGKILRGELYAEEQP